MPKTFLENTVAVFWQFRQVAEQAKHVGSAVKLVHHAVSCSVYKRILIEVLVVLLLEIAYGPVA